MASLGDSEIIGACVYYFDIHFNWYTGACVYYFYIHFNWYTHSACKGARCWLIFSKYPKAEWQANAALPCGLCFGVISRTHTIVAIAVTWANFDQICVNLCHQGPHNGDLCVLFSHTHTQNNVSVQHTNSWDAASSRSAPSQWEMALQSNAISHWLGANLESALLIFSKNPVAQWQSNTVLWCDRCCGVISCKHAIWAIAVLCVQEYCNIACHLLLGKGTV